MRLHFSIAVAALAVLIGGGVLAQTRSTATGSSGTQTTVTGKLVSIGPADLVIDGANGRRRFVVDAQSIVPAGLAAGSQVTVEYRNDGEHLRIQKVTLSSITKPAPRRDGQDPLSPGSNPAASPAPVP